MEKQAFNVYQLDYEQEFIDNLPVDFEKIKNMDLNTIPEIYHVLFMTDWNWGNASKMEMDDRMYLNDLYLEYMRNEVRKSIRDKHQVKNKPVIGFPKD
jgi:hypothetical protein